ncbi:MAG: translocation/assembly module TamB domain-containing protein [Ferruginibacter sp.]
MANEKILTNTGGVVRFVFLNISVLLIGIFSLLSTSKAAQIFLKPGSSIGLLVKDTIPNKISNSIDTIQPGTTRYTIAPFGTTYTYSKEHIVMEYPDILLNDFIIHDSLNNPLIINGRIHPGNANIFNLAMEMEAKDFSILNVSRAINNQLYGQAAINGNFQVSGTLDSPKIAGNIYLSKQSSVTLVLPEKNQDMNASKSAVLFIDRDTFTLPEKKLALSLVKATLENKQPFNSNLFLIVDTNSVINIISDPSTGDKLKVKGNAKLNVGLDSAKQLLLSGAYNLTAGIYELNYQFFRKQFILNEGSAIIFKGLPADAQINIMATYIANTPPKELVSNEIRSIAPQFAQSFNQPIPFRVILYMKGSIRQPQISFDIKMPESIQLNSQLQMALEHKLLQLKKDVAATNKQVFGLLVMGRFVGEQSVDFFKGSGSGFDNLASGGSVSGFLLSALDQIASEVFKGINTDLNLNSYRDFAVSDAAQGNQPDVDLLTSFLNNRLSVSVGRNFGIERQDGSAKAAKQKGSRFLPDVTLNYKLSEDGKYIIHSYKKDELESVLDGYATESGLGLILTMNYDKFKQLFTWLKKYNNN